MADYSGEAPTSAGTVLTQRTGTASADTVPAGALIIARNTGAGSHTMTFTVGATFDGLAVSPRVVTIAAGAAAAIRVPVTYADANNRVAVAINGTASEVLYHVVGA
ncbi:hypothetical protein AB0F72_09050 [Actinoplanes sp. NPDC023936]|uniref:hypothetical protein n=1 Tax=Actinoplanes sp. NPDC023936 TaxID=3154910 RepID=UPI0033E89805